MNNVKKRLSNTLRKLKTDLNEIKLTKQGKAMRKKPLRRQTQCQTPSN